MKKTTSSTISSLLCGTALCISLAGCIPQTNVTNCLSLSEVRAALASLNLPLCMDDTRQCENAIGPEDTPKTSVVCAYYHPDSPCGVTDERGCNTYGQVTYIQQTWICQDASGGSTQKTCIDEDNLTFIDTRVSCKIPQGELHLAQPCVPSGTTPGGGV